MTSLSMVGAVASCSLVSATMLSPWPWPRASKVFWRTLPKSLLKVSCATLAPGFALAMYSAQILASVL